LVPITVKDRSLGALLFRRFVFSPQNPLLMIELALTMTVAVASCVAADGHRLPDVLSHAQSLEEARDFLGAAAILLRASRDAGIGAEHSSRLASMLNNVGSKLQDSGKLREAETLYDASIRVWEMCFGGGYVASSQPLNNLASLYLQAGDPKRAAA